MPARPTPLHWESPYRAAATLPSRSISVVAVPRRGAPIRRPEFRPAFIEGEAEVGLVARAVRPRVTEANGIEEEMGEVAVEGMSDAMREFVEIDRVGGIRPAP